MEKIKISLEKQKNKTFSYNGNNIEVIPYLTVEMISEISFAYILGMFKDGKDLDWDANFANFMLRKKVVDLATNVDISDLEDVFILDQILNGDLYTMISERIENYDDLISTVALNFKNEIEKYKIEKSSGIVLRAIFERLDEFISELSKLQIPKEDPVVSQKKTKNRKKNVADYVE